VERTTIAGETEVVGENLPSATLSHHKFHMPRSGFEPRTAAVGSHSLCLSFQSNRIIKRSGKQRKSEGIEGLTKEVKWRWEKFHNLYSSHDTTEVIKQRAGWDGHVTIKRNLTYSATTNPSELLLPQKFLAFYATPTFLSAFTTACHWDSWIRPTPNILFLEDPLLTLCHHLSHWLSLACS
jgi:hypothetical protein